MTIKNTLYTILFIFLVITVASAFLNNSSASSNVYKDEVVIHTLSDAKGLNPYTVSDATSRNYMLPNIMQSMLSFDYVTMKLTPVLAVDLPEIKTIGDIISKRCYIFLQIYFLPKS